MTTTHAAAPWYVRGDMGTQVWNRLGSVATLTCAGNDMEGTASLIAAAPELLAQLQIAVDRLAYLKPERYDNPEHEAEFQQMLDGIYAAIAKAEGK